jgi:hypothetical protein
MLALEQALEIINAQETWSVNDDLCDCTYQRIGYWNNPYIGETYEIRLCCVWAEFEKQWPQFFKRVQIEPAEWNGEADMPKSIWHRQLAKLNGVTVTEAREMGLEPPKGSPVKPKATLYLKWGNEWVPLELA